MADVLKISAVSKMMRTNYGLFWYNILMQKKKLNKS